MLAPGNDCEDFAYTKQLFSLIRNGHAHPTATFGAPAMVWHVSFWPRRHMDPHEFEMRVRSSRSGLELKSADQIRDEHSKRFSDITVEFSNFLLHLQQRGCVHGADRERPFDLEVPLDWEAPAQQDPAWVGNPFTVFTSEACGFTLWWPDSPRHQIVGATPSPTDLRVRVQAEVTEDFSSITFYIDAGKPWDREPIDAEKAAAGAVGERRGKIFEHIKNVRSVCENRLAPRGDALVDKAALPERIVAAPPPQPEAIIGKTEEEINRDENLRGLRDNWSADTTAWLESEEKAAKDLIAAANYLYQEVWEQFCQDFEFNLCDIAGRAGEVFANFRGLVMPTSGMADTKSERTIEAATSGMADTKSEHAVEAAAADCGTRPFPRFQAAGEGTGYNSMVAEPNAVVKAFMPFMRRFRSDADWRDWVACGIFDWRAIYITPLGSQSEFRQDDEGKQSTAIPASHTRDRLIRKGMKAVPNLSPVCADYIKDKGGGPDRSAPTTHQNDRPGPFRYLLLTKHAPHHAQIGRMIERINTTGVRRLYALKNWTVLQQAGTRIRVYGQRLDEAYLQWIAKTDKTRDKYKRECKDLWFQIESAIGKLSGEDSSIEANEAIRRRAGGSEERAIAMLTSTYVNVYAKDISAPDRENWQQIDKCLQNIRSAKEERDVNLALHNVAAESALINITSELDSLGKAAIGGLSYRVSRSRYYANLYRDSAASLKTGNIETWWSYDQFAKRGMEPALRFIENTGDRLDKLRERLQNVKQDILQSSISNQTEATRDNTHKLERIQAELTKLTKVTEGYTIAIQQSEFTIRQGELRAQKNAEQMLREIHDIKLRAEKLELEKKDNESRISKLTGRIDLLNKIVIGFIGGAVLWLIRLFF